jgi:hypothetical protein
MSTLYRGPPIDASYQVSVHLANRFQRRRFFKICIEIKSPFWIQIQVHYGFTCNHWFFLNTESNRIKYICVFYFHFFVFLDVLFHTFDVILQWRQNLCHVNGHIMYRVSHEGKYCTKFLNQYNFICSNFYKLYKYNINISHNKTTGLRNSLNNSNVNNM